MRLSFHGAAQNVTGSCHLVEYAGKRILIDCGMHQGSRELEEENSDPFGFDPAAIDIVLLTHAHLDHTGRIPLLVKQGFRGEIIATAATFDLARLVLLDVAHLHEEAAARRARVHSPGPTEKAQAPLYSLVDASRSFGRFGRAAEYGRPLAISAGLNATFYDAGHILGSASILLEIDDPKGKHSFFFSGDIGNAGRPLFRAPQTPPGAEFVVMESTYGDRLHRSFPETVTEFYDAVSSALATGGNIIIPTFAIDRAQEILYFLRQGTEDGRFPNSMPVFLDSPMAVSATEIFRHHPESYNGHLLDFFKAGKDPFQTPGLKMVRERADSMAINAVQGGAVIMAGSGMCTGGRVLHHLRHNLRKPNASVIFVGYAAAGTLARRIIDGARVVRLFGEEIPVRARIHTINGFSAHADRNELIEWQNRIAQKRATFLVHGEMPVMKELASHLQGRVEIPKLHQAFELP